MLAVRRYSLGIPGYRWQGDQAMLGGPVPDATQWDQSEAVGDCASKVFAPMEREAAQGEWLLHDDTAVRILAWRTEHSARLAAAQAQGLSSPTERTGMPTTALGVKVGEHPAIWDDSSRRHAGENLPGLLDKREAGLDKPLAMSDALTSQAVADESRRMRCHCLAHGRRQCSAREDVFPQECQVVLQGLSQVFDHDEQARQEPLSPQARLAYHQAQSQPLLDGLPRGLDTPLDDPLVEPNSALGKALGSRPKPWETWTRFVSVPGAPLDNTLAERALKWCIRQRNNSLFSQSTPSADIASVRTSLSATGLYAGGNAVASLVALQEHRGEVFADPAAWVPWASASSRASPSAPRRQSRAICARSGSPGQSRMLSARADKGTRASALVGPQRKRPCESLFIIILSPWPSSSQSVSAVPARLRTTSTAPSKGLSPRRWRHTAPRPSMPVRQSTGSVATKMRLCGVSWHERASKKLWMMAARGSEASGECMRSRAPSGRCNSTSRPLSPGGWTGCCGTSTKLGEAECGDLGAALEP